MESVAIGFIHPGQVYTQFAVSIAQLAMADPRLKGVFTEVGRNSESNRNNLVMRFLEMAIADWLLCIDADMGFEPDLLERLLEVADPIERPMVSALFFAQEPGRTYLYPGFSRNLEDGRPVVEPIMEIPDEPFEVESIGSGCFLVHRSVLVAMGEKPDNPTKPWFETTMIEGWSLPYDQVFSRRVRKLGFPIYVAPKAAIDHYNVYPLNRKAWEDWKRKGE